MNKPEFTPGPWEIGRETETLMIRSKDGSDIAYIDTYGVGNDEISMAEGDASLIAAAPDLL